MQRPTLARWLVVGSLAAMGLFWAASVAQAQDNSSIQGQNGASEAVGASGDVTATNDLTFQGGAASSSTGGDTAQSQLTGDTAATVNQGAKASSADAAAGSQVTGCVGSCTVQGQNQSELDTAVSGPADASNFASITLGPVATSTGGPAQASQEGDDTLSLEQLAAAASGDAVAGSQIVGVVGFGSVQGQNSSEGSFAESGAACASFVCQGGNDLFAQLGPTAFSDDEFATAQSGQIGDNDAVLTQAARANSGDAVAGSQVTGIVGRGDSEVQQQNHSEDAFAFSGDAFATNFAVVELGPSAFASTFLGTASAQAAQEGDNSLRAAQAAESHSGDAIAGSQIVGLVNQEQGHIKVQNQQSSDTDTALSGFATAENDLFAALGPVVTAISNSADADAQGAQTGDNVVEIAQTAGAWTGDSLAGAQVTGVVDPHGSDVTVQNQNASEDAFSISGDADALNTADVDAGPEPIAIAQAFFDFFADCIFDCDAFADATASADAQAAQDGDTTVRLGQTAAATSGDAPAGSQVVGVVASGGALVTVQNQNTSEFAEANSGNAFAENDVVVDAGPFALATADASATADAICLFTCFAEAFAEAEADAQASQTGDVVVDVLQDAEATTGDAVSGSQVTGIVASGDSEVKVQNQDNSEDALTFSGEADTINFAEVQAGPQALSESTVNADADAFCVFDCFASASALPGGANAQSAQDGDDVVAIEQSSAASTGDALAGSQVDGIVAHDAAVTVQEQLDTEDAFAESGAALIDPSVFITAGPVADATSNAFAVAFANCTTDCDAFASAFGGDADAQAGQTGDNTIDVRQDVLAETGDALAGSQVSGVVAASDVTVQQQGSHDAPTAFSGDAFADAELLADAGPVAVAGAATLASAIATGQETETVNCVGAICFADATATSNATATADGGNADAQAAQDGDNVIEALQAVTSTTGDGIAGSQVAGVVANDATVTIQNQATSEDAYAESGISDALADAILIAGPSATSVALAQADAFANAVATATTIATCVFATCTVDAIADAFADATANAVGGDADSQASQIGDNVIRSEQAVSAETGDAVSGSQVSGVVASGGADVTVQEQNDAEAPTALSGFATADSTVELTAGPSSLADGSAIAIATALAEAEALATANCAFTTCDVDATASASAVAVADVLGGDAEAQAEQTGDNIADVTQAADASTGDAVAGSQVAGVVATGGVVTVAGQNLSEDAFSQSGDATTSNDFTAQLGPESLAVGGIFVEAAAEAFVFAAADCTTIDTPCDSEVSFTFEVVVEIFDEADEVQAQAQQIGDNTLAFDQDASASTGDAVAGSQISGLVVSHDTTVQVQNVDDLGSATSGLVDVANFASGGLGPFAESFDGLAEAQQDGDDDLDGAQEVISESGDGIAGSQIDGVVF